MLNLSRKHPHLSKVLDSDNFEVYNSHRTFSGIPIDQAHEQNNRWIKGEEGAIVLHENCSELLRWMVSGSEIARIYGEFEATQETHHSKNTEYSTPQTESKDLLVLDPRDIVDRRILCSIQKIQQIESLKELKSLFDPIYMNRLPLFNCPSARIVSKDKQMIDLFKKNCILFSQLFVS
ncbi:hypothetical protein Hamer_G001736, partial [Homarus americanus]